MAGALVIDRWVRGLFTQRNALLTPITVAGTHVIQHHDTLIDGLNMELSNRNTVERRPGFSVQCSSAVTTPKGFYSFRKIDGTIKLLVDTATKVQVFTDSAVTDLFTKSGGAGQARFQSVADTVYIVDGVDMWGWDGSALHKIGIVAPVTAPAISVNASQGPPPVITNPPIVSAQPSQQTPYTNTQATWEWDGHEWRTVTGGGSADTHELIITFTVPALATNAVVTGMEVSFSACSQGLNSPANNALSKLGWWNGSAFVGTPKSDATPFLKMQYKTYTYGGVTDLFGVDAATVLAGANSGTIKFAITVTNGTYRSFFGQTAPFTLTLHTATVTTWGPGTTYAVGTSLVDGNGNTEVVTTPGTTGGTEPIWNVSVGGTTTDNTVVWKNVGVVASSGGSAAPGLSPTSGFKYVYVYKNSTTAHISTASPTSVNTGAWQNATFNVSGVGSTDTQVDKVQIYRTLDGGAFYYFLTEFANAPTWSYVDSTPDALLNNLLVAPVDNANDPPPVGASNIIFHVGRLWMAVDNKVYFAGGPDVTNGVPEEAWPPANVFVFPGKVTAFASTSAGLLVFTSSDVYIIRGLDSVSFYSQKFLSNFGVLTQNAITQDGDLVYAFTTSRQLFSMSGQLEETGFDIGDKLMAFDPTSVYLSLHRSGTDGGLFVTDGATDVYRYNLAKNAWSPKGQPVGGLVCMNSIQTASGVQRLLIGQTGTADILYRNVANWQDSGSSYSAYATIGNIILATIGNMATLEAILIERAAVGTDATVALIENEITGSFVTLPNPVSEPPLLPASSSVIAKRHYMRYAATPLPQRMHHLQVKVTFPTENAHADLLTLGLMPTQAA